MNNTIITSRTNEKVKEWIALKDAKSNEYMLEGVHLVSEALKFSEVTTLIMVEKHKNDFKFEGEIYFINDDVASKISDTKSSQGIFAIVKKDNQQMDLNFNCLILDDIQDPGNMGTILRSAAAFGFKNVFATNNCVNFYNAKVLRSAQGNHFKLNLLSFNDFNYEKIKKEGYSIIGTNLHDKYILLNDIVIESKNVLVLGNEGNGMSAETAKICDNNVKINTDPEIESLNVAIAGSIIMQKFYKD